MPFDSARARARSNRRDLWISTGVLLVAAWAIMRHIDDLSMWFDELWSVFQASRSLEHVIRERELNWPAGYNLLLHTWIAFAGLHDFVIHTFGALIGLLSTAGAIRAGRALHSARAGWLAGLALGTSGYAVYFYLEARGYGLVMALSAALVWSHVRWTQQPTGRRAIPLVLAQIALLYTHFASGLVIALSAIRVILVLPARQWWRWLAVMGATGLGFLPLLPQFLESYDKRTATLHADLAGYFTKGPETIIRAYSLHQAGWFWLVVALAAVGLILRVWQAPRRQAPDVVWLLAWGVGIPVFAYLTRESQGLFTTRYLSFTVPAAWLLIALGLASLPRQGWLLGGVVLLAATSLPWQPFDHRPCYSDAPPVRDLVRELADRFGPGDVLVIDPNLDYGGYDWWYYEPLYFQGGRIPQAADGSQAGPRVWHLVRQGNVDEAVLASVQEGRIATEFWGPWHFIATLYQGPPLAAGEDVAVGEDVRFGGYGLTTGTRAMPGDTIRVETWWRVTQRPAADYSIGLHLFGPSGQLVAQADGGPGGPYTPPATSAWEPGEVYRDDRTIRLPWCLETGEYSLRLVVYQWWDGVRLSPADSPWRGPDNSLELATITVDSFSYCR